MSMNFRAIYSVAKKEFMDNLWNKWILALTAIFIITTIAASYLAGGQAGTASGFGGMEDTVASLLGISSLLVPIIAIMLGYATISGEAESGALHVVLSYPVRRIEVLLGKFLGLSFVLVFSILLGFGIGGIIIVATAGADAVGGFLAFIGITILLGMLYLSLAMLASSFAKKRSTSLGLGVLIFFWGMIYGMIVFGLYLGAGGSIEDILNPTTGIYALPDWIWASIYASPMDMSQMAAMMAFGVTQFFGFNVVAPDFMSLGTLVFAMFLWTIIPLILAYFLFKKRDI
jgi:ABC-type transport system involved in multi-copper enzyme maturation permease subunit